MAANLGNLNHCGANLKSEPRSSVWAKSLYSRRSSDLSVSGPIWLQSCWYTHVCDVLWPSCGTRAQQSDCSNTFGNDSPPVVPRNNVTRRLRRKSQVQLEMLHLHLGDHGASIHLACVCVLALMCVCVCGRATVKHSWGHRAANCFNPPHTHTHTHFKRRQCFQRLNKLAVQELTFLRPQRGITKNYKEKHAK